MTPAALAAIVAEHLAWMRGQGYTPREAAVVLGADHRIGHIANAMHPRRMVLWDEVAEIAARVYRLDVLGERLPKDEAA